MIAAHRACLALSLLLLMGSKVYHGGPPIPLGRDPGGTAIAILAAGFDYRGPEVAAVLARDGEGEAIARDEFDGDHNPFEYGGEGTKKVSAAAANGGVRVVMLRVDLASPLSVIRALNFASRTPARILLVPLTTPEARSKLVSSFATPNPHFGSMLFVAFGPDITPEEKAASDRGTNFLLLDSKDNQLVAAEAVARVLGCGQPALTGANGAELKTEFLARLQQPAPAACNPKGGGKAQ